MNGQLTDRDLVRLYWSVELRPAFDALFGIDDALAEVVTSSSQPALGAIRLAWWREALERLDQKPAPPEPRLQAAAAELLPRGIKGSDLAGLEGSWALLLQEDQESFMRGVATRGPALFRLAARLLDIPMSRVLEDAAQSFAAADLGRRHIFDLAPLPLRMAKVRVPRNARPLTALLVLARLDMRKGGPPFEPQATPGRAAALLMHRLSGIVT